MTDLFFCNFCDQSVPQQQLDDKEAIRHGGRVVCPTCCDTLTMAVRQQGGGRGLGLLALFLAVIGLGASAYLYRAMSQGDADGTQQLNAAVIDIHDATADMAEQSAQAQAALNQELTRLRQAQADALASQQEALAGLEERFTRLSTALEALEALGEGQQALSDRLQRSEARLGLLEDTQRELRSAQEFLRDGFAQVQREVAAAQVPAPADSGFSKEIEALLEKLQASDPLDRVDALQKLAVFNDPRLVAYVEPLLEDSYEMNRFYAAYTLGEWNSLASVPRLIPVLEDNFAFVRQSANEALVKITKEDMGFEEKGSEAERAKAVARWRDWAKAHEKEWSDGANGS